MKRVSIALCRGLATVALLATAASAPGDTPQDQGTRPSVTVKFNDGGSYARLLLREQVKSKVKKCRKGTGRSSVIETSARTSADRKGNWRVDAAGNVAPGTYKVTVKKKNEGLDRLQEGEEVDQRGP